MPRRLLAFVYAWLRSELGWTASFCKSGSASALIPSVRRTHTDEYTLGASWVRSCALHDTIELIRVVVAVQRRPLYFPRSPQHTVVKVARVGLVKP